ncbi:MULTISPECIES: hypothetical protein [unclassified Vibrio]|uniref:hypothetical protein n=1 Tax=unclassified Vibrio TaxID=2614977 RepID=UPI0012A93046|nr:MULTISPECIES: hypothetical protein [unclassified Vibrio]QFT34850.1 hypothetical protein FIU99_00135 [Vibrio sp. THAF64]QGM32748.1 hypothetical protein GGC04_00135 [Vibrio sp. THAF191d]QGN68251.1 hypothetical protein GGC03_00135 [Vibrio sp. THAF191c]
MKNKRPQKNSVQVELTPEECNEINDAMDTIRAFGGKVTVNKFIRHAAIQKAKKVNENG